MKPASRVYLSALLCMAVLCGCTAYNFAIIKGDLDSNKDEGHYIDGLLFFEQKKNWCGPAALAGVLRFWEDEVSQDEIARSIYLGGIKGTLTFDLENFAFERGHFAQSRKADLYELGDRIREGIPVIVMQKVLPLIRKYHYLVVFGYDDSREVVLVYSGKDEPELISYSAFSRKWRDAGNWMLVVCPPEKVGWEVDAYHLNRLGLLYEKSGELDKARVYYRKAGDEEKDNPAYPFNLANTYLLENNYQRAISFYETALVRDDKYADAYNNLAYCLSESGGDLDKAEEYALCALEFNSKNRPYYLDTLGSIYLKKGKAEEAASCFKEALSFKEVLKPKAFGQIEEHLDAAEALIRVR